MGASSENLLRLADSAPSAGNARRALGYCERVLEGAPDDFRAWLTRALCEADLAVENDEFSWEECRESLNQARRCATTCAEKEEALEGLARAAVAFLVGGMREVQEGREAVRAAESAKNAALLGKIAEDSFESQAAAARAATARAVLRQAGDRERPLSFGTYLLLQIDLENCQSILAPASHVNIPSVWADSDRDGHGEAINFANTVLMHLKEG